MVDGRTERERDETMIISSTISPSSTILIGYSSTISTSHLSCIIDFWDGWFVEVRLKEVVDCETDVRW